MRQVVCRQLGDPASLAVEDAAEPAAGPDEVVVEVAAAGVNFVDALIVTGGYQITPAVPFVPGSEVAGTVVAAGAGIAGWAPGDRAVAMVGFGGFAERVVARPAQLFPAPPTLTTGQAATCIQSYATMLYAYRCRTVLEAGQSVLVLGAGGGIGLAAIDLGAALGATVIAAASSPAKRRAAVEAGARHTIDYEQEDVKAKARDLSGGGVDVVVDPVGGRHAEAALRALRTGGRYLVLGFASGTIPSLPLNQVLLRNRAVIGVDWGAWSSADPPANRQLVGELFDLAAGGRIHPAEPRARPLDEAGAVLAGLLGRSGTGKTVLVP
jgi:NADPH2:quinone reductase